jgi:prolyl oligopeptidase
MRIESGALSLLSFVVLAAAIGCQAARSAPTVGTPPATRTGADQTTFFGTTVADPYRWLEDAASPEVQRWIDAQNAHAERVLASFPEREAIAKRVEALATTSADRFAPQISGRTLFYLRETPPSPQPVLVAQAWPNGSDRTLVDVNDAGGRVSIVGYWPSPSGRYVAYGTAEGGSELTTIRFRDVEKGTTLPDALPYAGGGTSPQTLAWDADEGGVTYARYPLPGQNGGVSPFDTALYHHKLSAPAESDAVAFAGFSKIAEYRLLTSANGKHTAVLTNEGDGGPADVYLRTANGWRRVIDASANVTTAAYAGDRLLIVVTGDAPRGRIVSIAPDGKASDLVREGDWAIQSVAGIGGGFLVVRSWGPAWRIDHYGANGTLVRQVALPHDGIHVEEIASASSSDDAVISYSGWTIPTRWLHYDGKSGALTTLFEVHPAADYSHVKAQTIEATSADGTKVPVSVLSLDSAPKTGTAPTILYGYGGYGVPVAPSFISANLAWIERGGVLAYAHTRGGNEFGEAWHQGGMLTRKQHVFDDFQAAATALVAQGWTDTAHLGAFGASNGGLLMGAAITQHPDTYRAVVAFVGIYDSLRHQTFPNGAYNVTEYGSTDDRDQFAALYAYSPLHHVKASTPGPAVLLETGVNDPRVAPWQSRKFAAALQAASSSGRPILLLTRTGAGHGVGAPFAQRVGNTAVLLAFLAHELGLGPAR